MMRAVLSISDYARSMTRLLALSCMFGSVATLTGCEPRDTQPVLSTSDDVPPVVSEEIFIDQAAASGLVFSYFSGASGQYFFPELTGGGAALFDYDGDGDLDVYFTNGQVLKPLGDDPPIPSAAKNDGNHLFRNRLIPDGTLQFDDVSVSAGVQDQTGYGQGVATGDYDNDGDIDLYVTNLGTNVFYRNDGDGTFSDVTAQAGADDERWTTSASFVDYDRDGDLDLFMTNYVAFTTGDNKPCSDHSGARNYCGPLTYPALPDRLFRNDNGIFTDVTLTSGIAGAFGSGLGVTCADYNNDGWQDIYVANDGRPNQMWINRGDGTFTDEALMSGSAVNAIGNPEAGMGVTAADFDSDGDEDLFMTHLAHETNTLYLNDGQGNFRDATSQFGLAAGSLIYTGFGTAWFDFDNDDDLDLFIANGAVKRRTDLPPNDPFPYHQLNQLYRNDEGRFVDISTTAGAVLSLSETSRGAAFGDIDNDGDMDIVVSNIHAPARLLINQIGTHNAWLRIRLEGTQSPRDATGAKVAVLLTGQDPRWRRAHTDGSYLSAGDPRVLFGLDALDRIDGIGVHWPSGHRERWTLSTINSEVALREGSGQPWPKDD